MKKDRGGIIPHVVVIIYLIFMTIVCISRHWDSWILPTIWFGALTSGFMFYTRGLMDEQAKAVFAVVVWIAVIIYSANTVNMALMLASISGVSVLLSMLDIKATNYISLTSTIFIFILNVFFTKNVRIPNNTFGLEVIMQFVAVIILECIEIKLQNDMVKRQEELKKTMDDLIDAERGKSDFMANVSHELRTPLNTICGMSDALLEVDLPAEAKEEVYDISVAGRRLVNIVDDILDYTELDTEYVNMHKEPYNLTSVLNDLINMAQSRNEAKNLEIILDCDAKIPNTLIGDGQKIYRVLLNILDNAIKFTTSGGIIIQVSFRRNDNNGNLRFVIRDTGVGMSGAELEKLDSVYNQVDSRRDRSQGGIGLGFAISRKTVAHMGGFMHIDSVTNEGTTVIISIPQEIGSDAPIAEVDDSRKVRMLFYVDMTRFNNGVIRESYIQVLEHLIEGLEIRVTVCANMAEFRHRVECGEYRCVVTAYQEYMSDRSFFNGLSKNCRLGIVADVYDDVSMVGEHIAIIQKPIHVFAVAAFLNGHTLATMYASTIANSKHDVKFKEVSILAVDDVMTNLKVTASLLRKYGIPNIDIAESGHEAIEKCENNTYDLIFMDHMMPGMDGVETLHYIRNMIGNASSQTPIVALTANAVGGAREMLLREGFDDFVSKPIEHGEMERVLKKYLSDRILVEKVSFTTEVRPLVNDFLSAVDEFDKLKALELLKYLEDAQLDDITHRYLGLLKKHIENFEFIAVYDLLYKEGLI